MLRIKEVLVYMGVLCVLVMCTGCGAPSQQSKQKQPLTYTVYRMFWLHRVPKAGRDVALPLVSERVLRVSQRWDGLHRENPSSRVRSRVRLLPLRGVSGQERGRLERPSTGPSSRASSVPAVRDETSRPFPRVAQPASSASRPAGRQR